MNEPHPDDARDGASEAARMRRPRWGDALLICGKCLKRHPDGKAVRQALKEAAQAREPESDISAGRSRPAKTRFIKTACLGLCPKRTLVVASAASLGRGEVALVRNPGEARATVARLLPRSPSPEQG